MHVVLQRAACCACIAPAPVAAADWGGGLQEGWVAEAVLPLWLVRAYEEGVRRALATAAVREEQERHQALKRAALAAAACCGTSLADLDEAPWLHV